MSKQPDDTIDPDGIEAEVEDDGTTIDADGVGDAGDDGDAGTISPDGAGVKPEAAEDDPGTIDADGNGPDDEADGTASAASDDEKLLAQLLGEPTGTPAAPVEPKAEAKPEAKPQPKAEQVDPAELADALKTLSIPKDAMEELAATLGDEATSKVITPIVEKVAKLQKYIGVLVKQINDYTQRDAEDGLLDAIGAPQLGSRWDADDKQREVRNKVVSVAATLLQNAAARGVSLSPKKAAELALLDLTRVQGRGNAPTQSAIEKRRKLVGVVPASARSTVASQKKGTKAAAAAVDQMLKDRGLA